MPTTSPSRVAIVTGASRGIGRAIAVALGGLGFGVAINYHANADAADEAAALVEAAGGKAFTIQSDIASEDDRHRMVEETAEHLGPISLLVNNAGVAPKVRADMLEMQPDSYDYVMDANLRGPYFLTQMVAHAMIEHASHPAPGPGSSGHHGTDDNKPIPAIINISSVSAYAASVNRAEYCIAKAGMSMMTQLYAARLAEHGILVYEIRPGIIATDMTSGVKAKYDKLILEDGITPIRRWGKPEDVAAAVTAIAEGKLPFSTGEVINVDGGFHMQRL